MNHSKFRAERILHAYVDGQLGRREKQRTLLRLETDERSRKRVCELQRTKEWVQFSFEDERAPTRELPDVRRRAWKAGALRVAASFVLVSLILGAGWISRAAWQTDNRHAAVNTVAVPPHHVILTIGTLTEAGFNTQLRKIEIILDKYRAQGMPVEVVTNRDDPGLARTASSQRVASIQRLVSRYDNARLVAPNNRVPPPRVQGQDLHLLQPLTKGRPLTGS